MRIYNVKKSYVKKPRGFDGHPVALPLRGPDPIRFLNENLKAMHWRYTLGVGGPYKTPISTMTLQDVKKGLCRVMVLET